MCARSVGPIIRLTSARVLRGVNVAKFKTVPMRAALRATTLQPRKLFHEISSKLGMGTNAVQQGRNGVFYLQQSIASEEGETENRSVGGSIPPLGTIKINDLASTDAISKIAMSALCPH